MALDYTINNAFIELRKDANLAKQVQDAIMDDLNKALQVATKEVDEKLLDLRVNESLDKVIGGFNIYANRDNEKPSQLYWSMVNEVKQKIFGDNMLTNIYILSALYIRNLKRLGYPDPINNAKEYATAEDRRKAQYMINIIGKLLEESLYQYYTSIGKNITKEEISVNIAKLASGFYGEYVGAIKGIESFIQKRTPNMLLKDFATELIKELDNIFMISLEGSPSSYPIKINGLISTMYSVVSSPKAISTILNALGQSGFYSSIFDEIARKIGYYIDQGLKQQQNQPAVPQPNIQQLAPMQKANQLQQNQQQGQQVPSPQVIRPQNQSQPNQQNNQQGPQTP